MNNLPYSPACERNQEPILAVLKQHFLDRKRVLEVGSGTGQHAVHFASAMPHLVWQTSDREENLPGIRAWLASARLPNTPDTLTLDVTGRWPVQKFDAVFSANTLHIMSWAEVERFFAQLPTVLTEDAVLAIYGPFRYEGRHTSDSNAAFEASLQAAVPHRGIRDFEAVDALANQAGLRLVADHAMPANNRCLVWRRITPPA